MQALLLGATGRTGKVLLASLLKSGYSVNAIVRNKSKVAVQFNSLTLFEGQPDDPALLSKAISGCEAVLSVLNVSRTSDFPWSKLRTPENFLSEFMKKLIVVAKEKQVKRIIVCSAWGVHETKKDLPGWFRFFIDHSNIGAAYRDHELQENILRESGLEWTIVRPAGLTNSEKEKEIRVSFLNKPKPSLTISRLSVATFMVTALQQNSFLRETPTISTE